MRIPPFLGGHGGSQRAWYLVDALRRVAPVHFVLVYRSVDKDCEAVSLEPLSELCETVTRIDIPGWTPSSHADKNLRWLPGRIQSAWIDYLRIRSHEAPRLSRQEYVRIAERLPVRDVSAVFAGRLPSATIVDGLIEHGLLKTQTKVCDFDDIMSRFRQRELKARSAEMGKQWSMQQWLDIGEMRKAERRICSTWDSVSVCTDDDVKLLGETAPHAHLVKAPNVVSRPLLPARTPSEPFQLLFVGNLNFTPNQQGLELFLSQAWPKILAEHPSTRLRVVGMFPPKKLEADLLALGVEIHANVPSVQPYYAQADAVICPILFGGGTRIKILEAMAYGRPVVSTSIGAEGLSIEPGRHALIADDMDAFAVQVLKLARDAELRLQIAHDARELQERSFGVEAIATAVRAMFDTRKVAAGGETQIAEALTS